MEFINDLESLVVGILSELNSEPSTKEPEFKITESTGMLGAGSTAEVQKIFSNVWRVGIIGDGNCLVHSLLFSTSSSYREQNNATRKMIAVAMREVLNTRIDELKAITDTLYPEIGWMALEESFDNLANSTTSYVNLELGPVIARLYGLNFVATTIAGNKIKPLLITYVDGRFDPALPSALVVYLSGGQALNVGGKTAGETSGGHYEAIVRGTLIDSKFAPDTTYEFAPDDRLIVRIVSSLEKKRAKIVAEAHAVVTKKVESKVESKGKRTTSKKSSSDKANAKSKSRSKSKKAKSKSAAATP